MTKELWDMDRGMWVGQTVWRCRYDLIEEGMITSYRRVTYRGSGTEPREDENGEYIEWSARFGSDWESQTYQWKFFTTLAGVLERYEEEARRRVEGALAEAKKWTDRADAAKAGKAKVRSFTFKPNTSYADSSVREIDHITI
jgi:hypothetical protein